MDYKPASIRLDEISLPPELPRTSYSPAGYRQLEDSMKQYGILVPILVRPQKKGAFELIDGATRLQITRKLGWPGSREIPAFILTTTDRDAIAVGIVVNQVRERLARLSEYKALKKLIAQGSTHKDAAEALGKTRTWATKMLSIERLPADVRSEVETARLPVSHAMAMAQYAEEPKVLNLLASESQSKEASARSLRRLGEEASTRGIISAKRRRPRKIDLTSKSWIRIEPIHEGLRAELHLNDNDDPSILGPLITDLLTEIQYTRRQKRLID